MTARGQAKAPEISAEATNYEHVVPRRRRGTNCRALSITCRRVLSKMGWTLPIRSIQQSNRSSTTIRPTRRRKPWLGSLPSRKAMRRKAINTDVELRKRVDVAIIRARGTFAGDRSHGQAASGAKLNTDSPKPLASRQFT